MAQCKHQQSVSKKSFIIHECWSSLATNSFDDDTITNCPLSWQPFPSTAITAKPLSPIWTQYLSECHLWITLSWFKTQFIINNVNYFTSSRLFLFSYSHSSRQQAPTALCLLPFSSYLVTTTLLPRLVLEECFSSFSPFSWI